MDAIPTDTGLDELDRRLVCALQINGRAGWGSIARALGVSERTVARRAGPLLGSGLLRVTAVRNAFRTPGWIPLQLRVRCRPGRVRTVADALARRPDTLAVEILGSGDEITAMVFAESGARRDALLLRDLPATPAIRSWTGYTMLHVTADSLRWNAGLLTPAQAASLTPPPPARRDLPATALEPIDDQIIDLLATDARMTHATLAGQAAIAESTARRRLTRLIQDGRLRVTTDIDLALLGFDTEAVLWLSVRPDALHQVANTLADQPATRFAGVTTGPTNLIAVVATPGQQALYELLTDPLGSLPGITHIETTPILRTLKRAGRPAGTARSSPS